MSFLRDSGGAVVLQGISAVLQFAAGVLLARVLLAEGRGLYALVVLIPDMARAVIHLGYGTAATRQVAKDAELSGRVLLNTLLFTAVVSGVTAAVLYLNFPGLEAYVVSQAEASAPREGIDRAILLALFLLPLMLLESYLEGLLTGLRQILMSNWMKVLQAGSYILLLAVLFATGRDTVYAAVWAMLLSFLLSNAAGLAATWQASRGPRRLDFPILRDSISFGFRTIPASIALYLLFKLSLYLMGLWRPPAEVGVYAVANSLALMFQILGFAVERALLPRVMKRSGLDAAALTSQTCRAFVMVAAPLGAAAALLAWPLVPRIFGADFAGAVLPFILFLPGLVCGNVGLICNADLLSRGHAGVASISATLALAVNFVLNYWLIQRYGMVGAAAAALVSYTQHGMTLAYFYHRLTGVPLRTMFLPGQADLQALRRLFIRRGGPA